MTTVTVITDLRGTFWWPSGAEWEKPVRETFIIDRDRIHPLDHASTMREIAERLTDGGDSQAAPLLSGSGFVELTRHSPSGHRTTIRRFPLDAFRSIADYLTD